MSTENLQARLLEIIKASASETRRYKEMEELTGIPGDRWKALYLGRQRPTSEMIEALCQARPEFAFWLSTGLTDPDHGHVAPGDNGYPRKSVPMQNSAAYFQAIKVARALAQQGLQEWAEKRLGADAQEMSATFNRDKMLRYMSDIGDTPVELSALRRQLRTVEMADKLRRAEVLLHGEMANLDYNATEALLAPIGDLLDAAFSEARTNNTPINIKNLEAKLQEMTEQVGRHNEMDRKLKADGN